MESRKWKNTQDNGVQKNELNRRCVYTDNHLIRRQTVSECESGHAIMQEVIFRLYKSQ
jgi:hypothetical protein